MALPRSLANMVNFDGLEPSNHCINCIGVGPFFIKLNIGIWGIWLISWMIAAAWRSQSTVALPRSDYRLFFVIVMVGTLLSLGAWPRGATRLWEVGPALGWSMTVLCVAGLAFAWWARIGLGKMWSGGIERTEDHRLVDEGAYGVARHPIYTGMIAMNTAIALLVATPWSVLGAVLYVAGLALKSRREERFLEAEIGGYEAYRKRVPMLIPFSPFG